jgi:integrase
VIADFLDYLVRLLVRRADDNPVRKIEDNALSRVPDRHQPFMGRASRQRPVWRAMRVKTVRALPCPLAHVEALLATLRMQRGPCLLMLDGGLRPGEVLGLRIPEDVQYGQRRVHVRQRGDDHPRGARQKSRSDRVVDLHNPRTLATVSDYVMNERPRECGSPYLFLVGGKDDRRDEHLSYQALWRVFSRCCDRLGRGPRRMHCAIPTPPRCGRPACASSPCRNAWATPLQPVGKPRQEGQLRFRRRLRADHQHTSLAHAPLPAK